MVLFCALGFRSALATKTLTDMGFKNVAHVSGGFESLKNEGLEIVEKERTVKPKVVPVVHHKEAV